MPLSYTNHEKYEHQMTKIVKNFLKLNNAHPKDGKSLFDFLFLNKAAFGQYVLNDMIAWMWDEQWYVAVSK